MSFTDWRVSFEKMGTCVQPNSEFSSCPLGQTVQTVRGRTVNVAKRHITRTFVRLDSEIQSRSRRGAQTRTRAEQVSSHTIANVHDTFDNSTEIPVLFGHQFNSIPVRIHFSVPTRTQHFHVRLWRMILMHQGETSIFVVQTKPPNSWS